jgi:hypothetical protein
MTDRSKAIDILDSMIDAGIDHKTIVEYIIFNHLSGHQALEIMEDACEEFEFTPYI